MSFFSWRKSRQNPPVPDLDPYSIAEWVNVETPPQGGDTGGGSPLDMTLGELINSATEPLVKPSRWLKWGLVICASTQILTTIAVFAILAVLL